MKLLAFTDIHADPDCLQLIAKKAKQADLLICPGDFTIFMEGFDEVVEALAKIDKPILLLHGNHEDAERVNKLKKGKIIPIHEQPYKQGDYLFLAHGGGGFSLTDKALARRIASFKREASKAKKVIFITHAPPFGTELDYLPWAGHVGCKTITDAIKTLQPHLFLCGHLHEHFGTHQKMGKTLLINPGPEGVIIEI